MPRMCGFAGIVSLGGADPPAGTAARMRDRILHRGPDGCGEFDQPGISLAACRLAIVDLDPRGRMPMSTPDGRFRIVFNGEIYNRPALRESLEAGGARLATGTDTEVLLHLFAAEGASMLDRLDGMFAFAIWDGARRELFAARDRCGEKPLFTAVHEGRLYFSSEPKALFAGGVPCAFDEETWTELVTFRSTAGTRTPYRGVRRLLPGHWLRAGAGGVETRAWWRFPSEAEGEAGRPAAPDRAAEIDGAARLPDAPSLLALLESSVRRRLTADVPVGVFLSGGLDSGSIAMLAAGLHGRPLPAFTARYGDDPCDEGPYAEAVARAAGVEHHQIRVEPEELPALLADAAWHQDEPMAFVCSPETLAVSRHARRHVRVLLTGEASDELFGGYARFRRMRWTRALRRLGRLLFPLERFLPARGAARRAVEAARLSPEEWIARSNADPEPGSFTRETIESFAPERAGIAARAVEEHPDPARQALSYERQTHLQSALDHCDRQTMAAGIEARVPLLAPAILSLAGRAAARTLFCGRHGKRILREAMIGRLPECVRRRPKQGWNSPYASYLRENPPLRAWLSRAAGHGIFASCPIGALRARASIENFLAGDDRAAHLAWILGRIVLWHQVCVEGVRKPF